MLNYNNKGNNNEYQQFYCSYRKLMINRLDNNTIIRIRDHSPTKKGTRKVKKENV